MVEDGSRARVLDVWFGSPFVKHFSEPAFVSIIVSFLLEAGLVFQTKRKNKKKRASTQHKTGCDAKLHAKR